MSKRRRPLGLSTSAIGSLPHTQRELALQRALSLDVPALPQLPRRDPAEYMIPQALHGFPGMSYDEHGEATVDLDRWEKGRDELAAKLRAVLGNPTERWDPRPAAWSTWRPFLWEVEERNLAHAKVQSAGPLTLRWVTKTSGGEPLSAVPEVGRQAMELILARLLSMSRHVADAGAQPIVFFDEPGLFALNPEDPKHRVNLEEFRVAVSALRNEGALVGIHCCSNALWKLIFDTGCDYLAVDTRLSLEPVTAAPGFDRFITEGNGLFLGVVPTDRDLGSYDVAQCAAWVLAVLRRHEDAGGVPVRQVLAQSLVSPACGLALRTIPEAERIFADLDRAQEILLGATG